MNADNADNNQIEHANGTNSIHTSINMPQETHLKGKKESLTDSQITLVMPDQGHMVNNGYYLEMASEARTRRLNLKWTISLTIIAVIFFIISTYTVIKVLEHNEK
ncbi:12773_t:CDS:2 [Ambispora leptoticha]|uniref:12773_t:CDS:1 n=1 Tax=Ambispora leptoticha TaxID=144679 RepID=A0A9N9EXP4_9GLOM|nr:12773_t:CDS:2 [Ambispora leptoticha]